MKQDYVPPEHMLDAFNCPYCGAFAHQYWRRRIDAIEAPSGGAQDRLSNLSASICRKCHNFSLWLEQSSIYPPTYLAPSPTADMPDDVKDDYEEARAIFGQSPRGAAALLRLGIQKLMVHLGESGENINDDIGSLVKKGLSPTIQKSLDIVRVVGNNAVHPGQIDLRDDTETALSLFKLVNLIIEQMITSPKEVEELYKSLPEGAKGQIEKRNKQTDS